MGNQYERNFTYSAWEEYQLIPEREQGLLIPSSLSSHVESARNFRERFLVLDVVVL